MSITPNPEANYTPPLKGYSGQGSFRFWCQTVLPLVYDDSLSYYELLNKVVNYLNNAISDVANVEDNVQGLHDAYVRLQNYVNDYFSTLDVSNEIDVKLDEMASDGTLSALIYPLMPNIIGDWLSEHITPTTPALDNTFSVPNTAALSTAVGEKALLIRSSLTNDSDLNDITQIGCYFCNTGITPSNAPDTGRARLVCFGSTSGGAFGVVQIWFNTANNKTWVRSKTSDVVGWSEWNVVTTNSVLDQRLSSIEESALMIRQFLTNDSNLNDITQIGSYFCNTDVTPSNAPDSGRARLVCFGSTSGGAFGVVQIWFNTANNKTWVRSKTSDVVGWSEWIEIANADDFSNALIKRTNLNNESDLNDITQIGTYFSNVTVTPANTPDTGRGRLVCFGSNAGFGVVQMWFNTDTHKTWVRSRTNDTGSWSNWVELGNANKVNTYKLTLVPGRIVPSSGCWGRTVSDVLKSVSSLCRYRIKNSRVVSVKWTPKNKNPNDETEFCDISYIFGYDKNGDMLNYVMQNSNTGVDLDGTKTLTYEISDSCDSIAFCVYNNSEVDSLPNGEIEVSLDNYGTIVEIKNGKFVSLNSNTRWCRFAYYMGVDENNIPIVNTGMIMFPPNYRIDGKPSPVILSVHGSDSYMNINGTEIADYETYFNYLSDCGFVLIDCYGWTSKYNETGNGLYNPWVMPTTCKAYKALIDLCLNYFNLDQNNMFVMCKSLGGHICSWIGNKLNFRAVAMLAPAFLINLGYGNSKYRQIMIEDMKLVGIVNNELGWTTTEDCIEDFLSNYRNWSNDKREAFYLANESQLMGYNGEFVNTIGDTASGLLIGSARKQLSRTNLTRPAYPPTKIWVAMDDSAIAPAHCITLAQQIRNSGNYGCVRIMPDNTGGHHAVDTDPNALKITNVTTPLGITYAEVPTAYYELYEFFNEHMSV